MRRIILLVFILFSLNAAFAETVEARQAFKAGYNLFTQESYVESIKNFKNVLEDPSYPLLDYSYYYIAASYQNLKHYNESIQVYGVIKTNYKTSLFLPFALRGIAQCQLEIKDYVKAETTLRNLIVSFPNHEIIPEARFLLATTLEKQNKHEDAARTYQNLDLLHPDSEYAEKAIEALDKLAKKSHLAGYEAPAATVYNLGIKYFNDKDYTKAIAYFKQIVNSYKKSSFADDAYLMLGRTSLRRNSLKQAATYFQKAINLDKETKPEALYYLARTWAYQNKTKEALYILNKVFTLYPNSHSADDALFYSGKFEQSMGNNDKALNFYEELISSYPNSELYPSTIWTVGNNYYKNGDYQKAYDYLSRTFIPSAENTSDQVFYWAAKSAEKVGNNDNAIAAYKAAIARFDHSYYSYRSREELQRLGIFLPADKIPDISELPFKLHTDNSEHIKKYEELLELELGEEAAAEADYLIEKSPLSEKDKAEFNKYHAFIISGKFSKPMNFAQKIIDEATTTGSLSKIEPHLWKFCYPRGYEQYVLKYAKQYGVDPYLIFAVIREESYFNSRALSSSRAHGLMQIIPSTGRKISQELGISYARWKLYDPRVNIQMGSYYLSQLIKDFNGNVSLALAAYNGGPVRVKKWLKRFKIFDIDEFVEEIPFSETRNYVKKVMKSFYGYKRTYGG